MSKRKKSFIDNKQARQAGSGTFITSLLRFRVLAGVAIIVLVAILAYLPCINGGFVLDDDLLLTKNPSIRPSDGPYRLWCTTETQEYYPLSYSTLWMEWRLWETNPIGYHVISLILHIVEALLIWVILRKMSIPGAFLAAMIFALHPVNVESVAWIAQRRNMVAMLFFLLSILWYLKAYMPAASVGTTPATTFSSFILHPSSFHFWYFLSLTAFVLAMLGKGSAAVLPLLLLGILWWLRSLTRMDLLRIAPFFLVAVLLTVANIWFQTRGEHIVIRNAGFAERLLGAGGVLWFYLYKALLPFDLAFIYPPWHIKVGDLLWWLPLSAAIIVTAMLWRYRKGWGRPLLFAWGFFCVSLVPVLGFTDVGFMRYSLVADHYQHIAIIAVIALAATGWSVWRQREGNRAHWMTTAVAVAAMGALTLMTWRQSGIYNNAISLYQATLQKNPGCWVAHKNLGVILEHAGRLQEAIERYEQALRLNPDYANAHYSLGVALGVAGRRQEAIEHYEQALRLNPDYADAHNNLGIAMGKAGLLEKAIEHYRQALRVQPDNADAHNNLGLALANTGRFQEAIEHYEQALRLDPDSMVAHNNLGAALISSGRLQEAIKHYEQALRLNPDYAEAHNNLGLALINAGRLQEAIEHYEQALRLNPDYAVGHNNLGIALASAGRLQEAIEHYEKALRLNPDYADAHYNLGIALANTGRLQESIEHYQQALRLNPKSATAHNGLGAVLAASDRLQEAITHYEQALRLNPDYADAHNNLGLALANTGRLQEAIEHYRHALRIKPDYAYVHNNLGVALANTGRLHEAIEHYNQTLRLKPDFTNVYINLALAYAGTQQSAEAIAAAQKGLELARSQGQREQAKQIEAWLNSYRAGPPKDANGPSARGAVSPPTD